jgi:hypothetical protein
VETCSNRSCIICSHCYWPHRISCRSIMLRQEELAFAKAISTMQLPPVILKELRMAMSRRKKNPAVPAGSCSITTGCGARAPNDHLPSSQASVKPTSWQVRVGHWNPKTGAQPLAMGPRLCPRAHRQSRANTLHPEAANS